MGLRGHWASRIRAPIRHALPCENDKGPARTADRALTAQADQQI